MFTIAAFAVPLTVSPQLADSYTLPKVALFRLVLIVILVLWLARLGIEGRLSWVRSPLDWPVAAFMTAALIAALLSTDRHLSFFGHYKRYEDIFSLVGYGLIYFAAVNNLKKEDGRRVLTAFLASAALISLYAVFQYFGYDLWRTSAPADRATGSLGNAVFLGTFLALALPAAIGRAVRRDQTRRGFYLYAAAGAVLAAGIVLSFSRGAWVGLVAGVAALALIGGRGLDPRRSAALLLVVVLVFAAANYARRPSSENSAPVVERARSAIDAGDGTVRTRLILWRTTAGLIAKRPIFGYGPDTLVNVYPLYLPDEYRKIEPLARIDKAHNEILNVGATLGLAGLAAYLVVIVFFMRAAWERRRADDGDGPALAAGVVGYLAAVQFSFSQFEAAIWFWLGLGLAVVAFDLGDERRFSLDARKSVSVAVVAAVITGLTGLAIVYIFSLKPVIADYHFQQGLRAEERGLTGTAKSEFRLATDFNSGRSLYYYRLGRRYHLDGTDGTRLNGNLVKAALEAYGRAEALDPVDPNLYTALGSLYTRLAERDRRWRGLAEAAFERSLALNRYLPETFVDRGVLRAAQGRSRAAVADFKRALALDPENGAARENLKAISD